MGTLCGSFEGEEGDVVEGDDVSDGESFWSPSVVSLEGFGFSFEWFGCSEGGRGLEARLASFIGSAECSKATAAEGLSASDGCRRGRLAESVEARRRSTEGLNGESGIADC